MAEKIAQTMLTLAEDNRDVKTSLRLMLKYEVHALLDRLSDLGEDSMLILANTNEGTVSHIGTPNATSFLGTCQTSYNLNLKDTFLKFCTSCSGNTTGNNIATGRPDGQGPIQNDMEIWKDTKLPQMQQKNQAMLNQATQAMANLQNFVAKQSRMPVQNRFSPYGQTNMSNNPQQNSMQQPFSKNFMNSGFPSGQNMLAQLAQGMSGSNNNFNRRNADLMKRNRDVCRHFAKGKCWQGNMCAFLHTRDPQLIAESLKSKNQSTANASSKQEEQASNSSSQSNDASMETAETKESNT